MLGEFPSLPGPSDATFTAPQTRASRLVTRLGRPFGGRPNTSTTSLRPPSSISPMAKQMRALRLLARLRQPFGALLLTPTRENVEEYRRVAAGSLITAQVEEITPTILDKLVDVGRALMVARHSLASCLPLLLRDFLLTARVNVCRDVWLSACTLVLCVNFPLSVALFTNVLSVTIRYCTFLVVISNLETSLN